MSSDKKDTDGDDFVRAMADVKPLAPLNRIDPVPRKTLPIARQRQLDDQAVMQELLDHDVLSPLLETGEELIWKRDGVQNRILRRLRSGQYSARDAVDLHHMNEETARQVLLDFISYATDRGYGCVRVIHGKGLRSKGLPKLKLMTAQVLRKHPRVICFASCRPVDGGTGATDVLLSMKKSR